jgi:2-oxoglutarate ferredoxin oxidoreductase subunit beta
MNKLGDGLDELKYYKDHSIIKHGADPAEAELGIHSDIIVGKFVDREKPTFSDLYSEELAIAQGKQTSSAVAGKK